MNITMSYLLTFLLAQSVTPPKNWQEIYNSSLTSVYLIQCGTRKGAGFLFRDNHHILTTLSVAGCGRQIWIRRKSSKKWLAVELKAFIRKHDIALLKAPKPLPDKPLPEIKRKDVNVGQPVAVLGHPYKSVGAINFWTQRVLTWSLTVGVVGRITPEFVQINMPLVNGFAGAPLLNDKGQIIGVLTTLGPRSSPIGIVARLPLVDKLFAKNPPREGWPFFAWSAQFNARFSYALGNLETTRVSPSNQEMRLNLIFWDQALFGVFVGFDLLSLSSNLDLSLLFGLDMNYRFLMPRETRPYLDYVSVGLGAMAMQVKIFVSGQEQQNIKGDPGFSGVFRVTFWGGFRFFSLFGQFSLGVFFDVEDLKNPVLSFSWGLSS